MMDNSQRLIRIIWGCAIFAGFVFLGYGLQGALVPLLLAFMLAYLFLPFAKYLAKKGIPRQVSALIVMALVGGILALVLGFGVPYLATKLSKNFLAIQSGFFALMNELEALASKLGVDLHLQKQDIIAIAKDKMKHVTEPGATRDVMQILQSGIRNTASSLVFVLNLLLLPVFFFYILINYEAIYSEILGLIPVKYKTSAVSLLGDIDRILAAYIRGQLNVSIVLAVLYCIGLSLVGLPNAIAIGVVAGMLNVVPYFGTLIGVALAGAAAASSWDGFASLLGPGIVFVIVQLLEGNFITPKVMSGRLNISPLGSILAIIIGGNLLGLFGMLIGIPSACFLSIIYDKAKARFKGNSKVLSES